MILLFTIFALVASAEPFRSVCYYSNWAQYRPGDGKFLPENVDVKFCTHICYAFAKPVGLDLNTFEWNDDDSQWSKGMYSRVIKLKESKPNLKVLLAIGGWNMASAPFIPLVVNQHSRETFARNAITFLRKRSFDGLDVDWEYPGSRGSGPEDKIRYLFFIQTLKAEFEKEAQNSGKPRLLLTIAVAAGKSTIDAGYEVANLTGMVDFISLMTYDFHGGTWENITGFNSPLYSHPDEVGSARYVNLAWAAEYWVSLGAKKEKLNIGLATYGRTFTLANPSETAILSSATGPGNAQKYSREAGIIAYYEVCDFVIKEHAQVVNVPSQGNPYAFKGNQWVGYDDPESISQKTCYAMENGYGGVMFWTLDFDDFAGKFCNKGAYPLLSAAYNAIQSSSTCPEFKPATYPTSGQTPEIKHSAVPLRSVCYYTNWAQYRPGDGKYIPENIDITFCTHICYAFAKPVGLDIQAFEWNDDDTEWSKGMYSRVINLKERKPNLKVLLAIGGWNMASAPFIPLVVTQQSRETFARNAITFLRRRRFDGLDVDWEYPGSRGSGPEDKLRYRLFIQTLKAEFEKEAQNSGKPRLLLTIAVAAGKSTIDTGYEVAELTGMVDFISIMTYDFHGGTWENVTGFNSPLYPHPDEVGSARYVNLDWAAKYWVSLGAKKEKLNIGMATYGRTFALANPSENSILSIATGPGNAHQYSREAGIIAYYEVCDFISKENAQVVKVPSQGNPYAFKGNQWVGYDDPESIAQKTCYTIEHGYGGVMFWTVDFDDFAGKFCNNGSYPLLTAAYNVIQSPHNCPKDLTYKMLRN